MGPYTIYKDGKEEGLPMSDLPPSARLPYLMAFGLARLLLMIPTLL